MKSCCILSKNCNIHGKNHEFLHPNNFWTLVKRNIPDVSNWNCWILLGLEFEVAGHGPLSPLPHPPTHPVAKPVSICTDWQSRFLNYKQENQKLKNDLQIKWQFHSVSWGQYPTFKVVVLFSLSSLIISIMEHYPITPCSTILNKYKK